MISQSSPFWGYILHSQAKVGQGIVSSPWVGVVFCVSIPQCLSLQPDPFLPVFSPTGAWRQRVSPNCALWAGVTELPKQRRGILTKGVNFTSSQPWISLLADDKTKHQA